MMSCRDVVDLCSDDESGPADVKVMKLVPDSLGSTHLQKYNHKAKPSENLKFNTQPRGQESEENRSSNALSAAQSSNSILEQGQSPVDDTGISSMSTICPAPLCRQFWKAGNYEDGIGSKVSTQNGKNFLHVHPMFLHSNATSHKWAFGAIAELLDNAVDEIQNGATFVIVDKTTNPRNGSPALLIQDDGGGMDPEAMRRCMSFGFSDKKSKSSIGRYGNGFKTSSMRLGADVIVFSCHEGNRTSTQSIGLLSYTFLTQTGHDRIVVPMVNYEINSTGALNILHDREHFRTNLSLLTRWSPFSSEAELLKQLDDYGPIVEKDVGSPSKSALKHVMVSIASQLNEFDDIGPHGTKVIIYNLWFSDEGRMELDFDSDPEDIQISGDIRKKDAKVGLRSLNEQHIAKRLHYSLRAYMSILYLRVPETFSIILRSCLVEHHNIADDLKFPEFILYRPQSGGCVEGTVITTIGFLKEAPHVNIHGFNVYHKNRLILPYWQVVSYTTNSRGRGVVGVLEANFIEPTHNKQDFERTSLFQKLETRLKEMTWEYWDYHCALIGYQASKKPRASNSPLISSHSTPLKGMQPVVLNQSSAAGGGTIASPLAAACQPLKPSHTLVGSAGQSIPCPQVTTKHGSHKRKEHRELEFENVKKHIGKGTSKSDGGLCFETQPVITTSNQLRDQEATTLMQENKKLHAKCFEYDKRRQELNHKVTNLRRELGEYNHEYDRLLAELRALEAIKVEKKM